MQRGSFNTEAQTRHRGTQRNRYGREAEDTEKQRGALMQRGREAGDTEKQRGALMQRGRDTEFYCREAKKQRNRGGGFNAEGQAVLR
jgi:hypothetical protein